MMMSLVSSCRDPESCPGVSRIRFRRWAEIGSRFSSPFFFCLPFHICLGLQACSVQAYSWEVPGQTGNQEDPGMAIGHSVRCMLG